MFSYVVWIRNDHRRGGWGGPQGVLVYPFVSGLRSLHIWFILSKHRHTCGQRGSHSPSTGALSYTYGVGLSSTPFWCYKRRKKGGIINNQLQAQL